MAYQMELENTKQNLDAAQLMNSVFTPCVFNGEGVQIDQSHNQKILHNGFTFTFDKQSSDGSRNFWRCSKKHGCTARLHTDPNNNDQVIKVMNEHSHEPKMTRESRQKMVLNGIFTRENGFEEMKNQTNELEQSGDSLSLDSPTRFFRPNDSPSMPKLEPQRKWTNARKQRIFDNFTAGLLKKEPFETDPYFSRLVNAEGQRVAVICNYCNNIYSPQTGGQQAYHKRVCSQILKVRSSSAVGNGDQSDMTDYDTSTQSPVPPNSYGAEMDEPFLETKHSMSLLHAMLDTADNGAHPGEEDSSDTSSPTDQFNASEQGHGVAKRAKLVNVQTDQVTYPRVVPFVAVAPKISVSLKDVEGMPMVAKITPKRLHFSDFRRIFLIPKNHSTKRFMFKCECDDGSAEFQWLLAMEDDMELPVFRGQVVAEALQDAGNGGNKIDAIRYWTSFINSDCSTLAILALEVLSVPATSAPIERIFSQAGIATKGYRNKTKFQLLNAQLVVYCNSNIMQ
uniref:HAT C-terminal dimerisation domain-containing protein n=1 Tax=Ditylenchus dipsaci TaxID=166011 RepID=A0A915CX19_9BILA